MSEISKITALDGVTYDIKDALARQTIPTKTSELTNDSGFITGYTETDPIFSSSAASGITSTDISNWNNKSDFSGSYNDLDDKPSIPSVSATQLLSTGTKIGSVTVNSTTTDFYAPTSGGISTETDPVFSASAAHGITSTDISNWNAKSDFSGSYNDLSNKPTIPTAATATPSNLGTAAVGSSSKYAKEDHVHKMPSASDVGLGNVANVLQYSASNPPPYPVTSVNGSTGSITVEPTIKVGSATLATASWTGNGPYTQTVTISGITITSNSKVDIQPDATAIQQMITDECAAIYIDNNNGTLTAYAIGSAPTSDLTVQVTVMEVS